MKNRALSLMYHRVVADTESCKSQFVVSKSTFYRQMEYLARHQCTTPTLDEITTPQRTGKALGKRPVIITFDDGYLDNCENALPVLLEFGFTAVIFVVTDFSRRSNWWDDDASTSGAPLMQPAHILKIQANGLQIGSHTHNHRSLPGLPQHQLEDELKKSKDVLENIISRPVTALAYPYGDVDNRVKDAARKAGYLSAFAVNSGPFDLRDDLFEVRRQRVLNRVDAPYLFSLLSGIQKFAMWGRWAAKNVLGLRKQFPVPENSPALPERRRALGSLTRGLEK